MGALSLLNFVLVALPIGSTLGVLLGLQAHRDATGQEPLFKPTNPNTPPKNDGITLVHKCNETVGISPASVGDKYTLNPNPWGWSEGEEGSICMDVITWNNQTYPTKSSAPEWSVTWEYPAGSTNAPVHAFPNVKVDSGTFPVKISKLKSIYLDFEWSYAVGNTTAVTTTDVDELETAELNANVALDMFLDSDKTASKSSEDARIEMMVWFATFGPSTVPIGNTTTDAVVDTLEVDGTTFSLYAGKNNIGQRVLTWYSQGTADRFHGDLMLFVNRLVELGETQFPTGDDYIGYASLGTETYWVSETVTFHVPTLAFDIETD
ncbi:Glycosyl hydrolase family 12 [Geosmithia morbida]|uniref:Glycosyl hydrolase family 12 n=1 Tax=Geosmithia morbida TaxID=1094350 RepID=A0A9P4YQI0_9HYPO|nr:Glycosyl hydrolase family 12 [Geosmithia morbida]KAF4119934.1 Glycosyl hydrolase family 12 [Geosmithia morbida]